MDIPRLRTDVLILGAGGAGLFAALPAHPAHPPLDLPLPVPGSPRTRGSAHVARGPRPGLRIVAEGVETAAQDRLLRRQGCDIIQGHWVSLPLTAEALGEFLRESHEMAHDRRQTVRPRLKPERPVSRELST